MPSLVFLCDGLAIHAKVLVGSVRERVAKVMPLRSHGHAWRETQMDQALRRSVSIGRSFDGG
ncbi:hypothetical protein BCAR13_890022 [Paraburkholderia caribensis]|nr:hypothetical protein BCAR13_890022 [Paraburkholderia caribensis]